MMVTLSTADMNLLVFGPIPLLNHSDGAADRVEGWAQTNGGKGQLANDQTEKEQMNGWMVEGGKCRWRECVRRGVAGRGPRARREAVD